MNLDKILAGGLLIASLAGCGGGGSGESGKNENPPTVNSPPVASLFVDPTSGSAPLEVLIQLTCTDPDGMSDIKEYIVSDENSLNIIQSTPIDTTRTYNEGSFSITGECVDNAGARSALMKTDVTVTAPPNPTTKSISQTAELVNFVDIDYCAELKNVSSATRTIFRNGNKIGEKTITKSSCEPFKNSEKGNYLFNLTAPDVTPHSIDLEVPNYNPKVNLSNLNLDMNDTILDVELPTPTDKNPEDNRVFYTSVESLDGKVNPILGAPLANTTPLTIENFQDSTGEYQIKLRFGSVDGGTGSATKSGNIVIENRPKISGQLQSN